MVELNTGYVKSIPGILKIVEFILLLLSFSCISDCCYGGYGTGNSRISFFLAVGVIGWLIVGLLFVFFLFKLTEKVQQVNFNLVVFITSIVFAVLLLISASLVADLAHAYRGLSYYSYWSRFWDTMVAGVVFGFFAMVAFIIDAVMHISAIKGGGGGGGASDPKA